MRRLARFLALGASLLLVACGSVAPPGEMIVGGCGPMPGLVPLYRLPFPAGHGYLLTQGNCESPTHDGRFRFAFDFRMPVGTPVVAARDGIVRTVRADRPDGTGRTGDENLVFLEHPDGQVSRYIHLREGGVRVSVGQAVRAGDTIAVSGNSGRSAFPHLHFDVADDCGPDGCSTRPVAFVNADPPIPRGRTVVRASAPADMRNGD